MHRQIAGKLTGPVTKWIVLAAWLVLFVGGMVLNGKLDRACRTTRPSSWLPALRGVDQGGRRAVRHDQPQRHPDPRRLQPQLRPHRGRLRGRWTSRPRRWPKIDGVTDAGALSPNMAEQSGTPVPARLRGRRGRLHLPHLQLRPERLERHPGGRRPDPRDRADRRRHGAPRRLRRPGRRRRRGVRGHRQQPDPDHLRRGDRDPAVHLPQPDPVDPADLQCRRRLHGLRRRGLPAREVRRPHRQRAEPGDPAASW